MRDGISRRGRPGLRITGRNTVAVGSLTTGVAESPLTFIWRTGELVRMNTIDCEVSMAKMRFVHVAAISVEAFAPRPGGTR